MANFILIHGAWHGGWCWERVVPLLRAAGHSVLAPDLPGMGDDRTPFGPAVLSDLADWVCAQTEPVVLVGHSRGGVVISEVAERVPDRISRLVYLTAFLLPDGQSLMGFNGTVQNDAVAGSLRISDDGQTCTIDPARSPDIFYGGCAGADASACLARLTPEPLAAVTTPVRVTPQRFGTVPRAYIEATDDHAIRIGRQRAMHAALPCDPVITLACDHSPFYSMPDRLAQALLALA